MVRTATDTHSTKEKKCVCNETPVSKPCSKGKNGMIDETNSSSSQNTINIQLLYNINQAMEPDTWDGNFHFVSLHSSHLMSGSKNIKESLCCMIKYILNKKVESGKANEVNNFKGIGKAAWGFILALYESEWDRLITNNNNHSFRCKVKAQFTPKINEGNNNKKVKDINSDKPALISKLPSLILAKSPKEINNISKFFKKNNNNKEQKNYMLKLLCLLIILGKF